MHNTDNGTTKKRKGDDGKQSRKKKGKEIEPNDEGEGGNDEEEKGKYI